MRVTRLAMLLVAATGIALLLSACAGGVHGPVIEGNRRNGGTDALVGGVVIIEAGCLYVGHTVAGERYPVVWPHGTSWDSDESAVKLRNGTLVHVGDSVWGGGGAHDVSTLGGYTTDEGKVLAEACIDNTYDEVTVFNSGESVDVERQG